MVDLSVFRTPAGIAVGLGLWAAYTISVLYLYIALRWMPADLIQVRMFQKLELLRRGILLMSLGLAIGSLAVLMVIIDADVALEPLVLLFLAGLATFAYGISCYTWVFRLPRAERRS